MYGMFHACENLTNLDISSFDTSKVKSMSLMFRGCAKLISLDVSSFNTSNVTDMTMMFQSCESLTELNLSNFDTSSVIDMDKMFSASTKLKTIYVSNLWNTENVTESINMFFDNQSLVGGYGTKFSSNYRDKTYARVDKGANNPGYFTYKENTI